MKNIKQPSAFSNVFQITPHVPELSPFSLISIYVHPLWKITSWTPPPLFPITITNSPPFYFDRHFPLIQPMHQLQSTRFSNTYLFEIRGQPFEKQHPVFRISRFPRNAFSNLGWTNKLLKSSRSEFGLICDKKLSLISRLEFFFLFSLNKQREDLPFLAKEKYWNIRFNLVIAYFCFMWKYRDIIVYLLLIYDLRLSINENNL